MDKSKFQIVLLTALIASYVSQECKDVKPDKFPYQAIVKSSVTCGGALISARHVVTLASCVYGSKEVKVFLGFYGYPYEQRNWNEPQAQICKSKQIIIHDSFIKLSPTKYINNVAIAVLIQPARLTSAVQPIALSTEAPLPGSYLNVSGWTAKNNHKLRYCRASILNTDTCSYQFGSELLPSQEFCLQWYTSTRLNLIGNIITANGQLVGFQSFTPKCLKTTKTCTGNDVITNILPFVRWIQASTGIPLRTPNTCSSNATVGQQQITQDYKDQLANINKELERLSSVQSRDTNEIFSKIKNVTEQCQQLSKGDVDVKYQKEISELRALIETNKVQLLLVEKTQNTTLDAINELKNDVSQQHNDSQALSNLIDAKCKECKTDMEKQVKLIEDLEKNNMRDVNEKLQFLSDEIVSLYKNLSNIKQEVDQKPASKDIVAINKQLIVEEVKKENQNVLNHIASLNRTLQSLLQKLQTTIVFPELT
ncbi:uncharacterized protein LOC143196625 isoform X1 [Rhynchophorus ferrugineus]|uniref:uncharacterized protein LOC143196625 isoform X1 n=1 Tax=Rhynchophorus ferrugineus TaxID=354439 RepID=UPI003FCE4028